MPLRENVGDTNLDFGRGADFPHLVGNLCSLWEELPCHTEKQTAL